MKKMMLLLAAIGLAACSAEEGGAPAQQGQMPPAAVSLVNPVEGEMTETVTVVGTVRANESALISSELSGIVEKIHFNDGQFVEAGTVLFTIESSTLRAELQRAEATVKLREEELNRVQSLFEKRVASQYDVDKARTELATAEADRDFSRAQLKKATITAPFSGYLGIRKINEGNYVEHGDALVALVNMQPLFVDFDVPETAVGNIVVGDQISVEIQSLQNKRISGKIVAMDPALDEKTRSLKVRSEVSNQEQQLKPGMFAKVLLPIKHQSKVLWIPEAAVFYRGDKTFVRVNNGGTSLTKEIIVASFQNGKVAVVEGLALTDEVIAAGHHKLPMDGMPLFPQESVNLPKEDSEQSGTPE